MTKSFQRTPQWELSGFRYLVKMNPKKYVLASATYLDGMFVHYRLVDRGTSWYIGNTIVCSMVTGVWSAC